MQPERKERGQQVYEYNANEAVSENPDPPSLLLLHTYLHHQAEQLDLKGWTMV